MSEQNTSENVELLVDLAKVSVERDKHLQEAERLRLIRDGLIEKAFATKIPRKTIAAASLLKEISLYKMMARRSTKDADDLLPEPDNLFSEIGTVEVYDSSGNIGSVEMPEFSG